MNVIQKIHAKLPRLHMVMHGSSSVPQELQDIINENGGEMPTTFGVPRKKSWKASGTACAKLI